MQESAPICSPLQLRIDRIDRTDRIAYRPARRREGRERRYRSRQHLNCLSGADRRAGRRRSRAERRQDDDPQLCPAFYGHVTRQEFAPEAIELARLSTAPLDQGFYSTEALKGSLQRRFDRHSGTIWDAVRATRIANRERDASSFSSRLRHKRYGKDIYAERRERTIRSER